MGLHLPQECPWLDVCPGGCQPRGALCWLLAAVLYSDVDVVFLANPLPLLYSAPYDVQVDRAAPSGSISAYAMLTEGGMRLSMPVLIPLMRTCLPSWDTSYRCPVSSTMCSVLGLAAVHIPGLQMTPGEV